jgi:FkbH-like protein
VKIALLSNINMDPLAPLLADRAGAEARTAGFNQWMAELLDPASAIRREPPDAVFLHLDGEAFLGPAFYALQFDDASARLDEALAAIAGYRRAQPAVTVVASNLVFPSYSADTGWAIRTPGRSLDRLAADWNGQLAGAAAADPGLLILDVARLFRRHGYDRLCDEKYWYLARMRFSGPGFDALAAALAELLAAHRGAARKVLALDLDNTLWGGVIGEEGLHGIILSEEGLGKAYRDFQWSARALKDQGVLLALCSKNNEADAAEAFANHPMMVLKWDDFAVRRVNWNNKVDNLREIAAELDLGLDAVVFIDDQPAERALVREQLPEIATPEPPSDPAELKRWFLSEVVPRFFGRTALTAEDRDKSAQYERRARRQQAAAGLDLAAFIRSLNIQLKVHVNAGEWIERAAQLTQKTNQFNLTGRRWTAAELSALMRRDDAALYLLEYADKFGPEGIVGEAIVRIEKSAARLDVFLMSCRIIGRRVEFDFLGRVLDDLQRRGVVTVRAEFIPTARNSLAAGFLSAAGFQPAGDRWYEQSVDKLREHLAAAPAGSAA